MDAQPDTPAHISRSLLAELEMAHVIIRHALNLMTPEQKAEWGRRNFRADAHGEGITRANERAGLITMAGGSVK